MLKLLRHAYRVTHGVVRETLKNVSRSSEWPTVRKHFLENNPTCAACGSKVRLRVHHQKPFHITPELELDPTNLITLCMGELECHLVLGHGDDFKAYNPHIKKDAETVFNDRRLYKQIAEQAKIKRQYAK